MLAYVSMRTQAFTDILEAEQLQAENKTSWKTRLGEEVKSGKKLNTLKR